MSCFPPEATPNGNTEKHLLDYLNKNVPQDKTSPRSGIRRVGIDGSSTSLQFGRNTSSGRNEKNKRIASHFLSKGIKAIRFLEHGEEVVAVFDPSCIRVLPESTNLEVHPFSDILAANDPGPAL
jgi:hypothetical protein